MTDLFLKHEITGTTVFREGAIVSQVPNPMADMIEQAVGDAIEARLRKVIQEELAPIHEFTQLVNNLVKAIAAQRGKFARLLAEATDNGSAD